MIEKSGGAFSGSPVRMSIRTLEITALRYIVDEWLWSSTSTTPGAIPAKLKARRKNIKRFVLPPRRSVRRYQRAVKMTKTYYPIKNAAQA